jgi:hypothetical protein
MRKALVILAFLPAFYASAGQKVFRFSHVTVYYMMPIQFNPVFTMYNGFHINGETPVNYMKRTKEIETARIGFTEYQVVSLIGGGLFITDEDLNAYVNYELGLRYVLSGGIMAGIFFGAGMMKSVETNDQDNEDTKKKTFFKKAIDNISFLPSVGFEFGYDMSKTGGPPFSILVRPGMYAGSREFYFFGQAGVRYRIISYNP